MPYGTPTDPVAGTVITVAYAVANFLDPIRWLRLMTGGSDPPGSNYVVRSTSTTATAWSKVTTDTIGNGEVRTSNILDRTIVNTKLALLTITGAEVANTTISGDAKLVPGSVTGNSASSAIGANTLHANRIANETFNNIQVAAAFATGALDAANVADIIAANAINGDAKLAISSVTGNSGTSAIGANSIHGNRVMNGTITNTHLADDAVTYAKLFSDDTPANGDFVTINTTTGKFEYGTPASVAGVPSGLIALWSTATPPSGWTIYTTGAGRFVVGAGGTLGAALGATGGSSTHSHSMQSHTHTIGHGHDLQNHSHSGSTLGIAGATSGPTGTGTGGGTGATFADGSHTHGTGTLDVSGNTAGPSPNSTSGSDTAGSGAPSTASTDAPTVLPPYLALHYIIKS